jgi:hypothetical protein
MTTHLLPLPLRERVGVRGPASTGPASSCPDPPRPNATPPPHRCGAKTRTGTLCSAPAMANGRCRIHGGTSTGPRTPEGKLRMAAAHTKHGKYTAPKCAKHRFTRTLIKRTNLTCAARDLSAYLPPDMAARLAEGPDELWAPARPENLPFMAPQDPTSPDAESHPATAPWPAASHTGRAARSASRALAAARQEARVEAAALAPWREAIAFARAAKRATLAARREERATRRAAWAASRAAPASTADGQAPPALPPAADAPHTAAVPSQGRPESRQPESRQPEPRRSERHAPAAPRTPRTEPIAPDPAQPVPLKSATRRRLKYLQRCCDRAARPHHDLPPRRPL